MLQYDLRITGLTHVIFFCDNDFAIKLAHYPVFHEKTKLFEVDLYFICEKFLSGIIKVLKIRPSNQNAYILTNCLVSLQHEFLLRKIGLIGPFSKNQVGQPIKIEWGVKNNKCLFIKLNILYIGQHL